MLWERAHFKVSYSVWWPIDHHYIHEYQYMHTHHTIHSNVCLPCNCNYISLGVSIFPGCPPPWPGLPQHPGGWGEAAQDIRLWSLQRHTRVRVLPPGQDATEVDGTRDCDWECLHRQVWCVSVHSIVHCEILFVWNALQILQLIRCMQNRLNVLYTSLLVALLLFNVLFVHYEPDWLLSVPIAKVDWEWGQKNKATCDFKLILVRGHAQWQNTTITILTTMIIHCHLFKHDGTVYTDGWTFVQSVIRWYIPLNSTQ